jgi:malate dehydrogenase (quinone)
MSAPHEVDSKLSTPVHELYQERGRSSRKLSGRITGHMEAVQSIGPTKTKGGCCGGSIPVEECDVLLIGGGVMSATMGLVLKSLEPSWRIVMYERLGSCGEESSNGWNNAGTGHSALCELNYTKDTKDKGTNAPHYIDATKALSVNEQFQLSRQFWAYLCKKNLIKNDWIQSVAHMSFVVGEKNVDFLGRRFARLSKETLFKGIQYSEDARQIEQWAPLLIKDRDLTGKKFAATHMPQGTDVDFGVLTKQMVQAFSKMGGEVFLYHTVTDIKKGQHAGPDGQMINDWVCTVSKASMGGGKFKMKANFVFAGAGGWALLMLQKAGIPGVRGYAGGPVSGQFLVCQNPKIVEQHKAKVYTKGEIGAPPMSEPHLDARIIEGKPLLLFGPYAGLNTRFLKTGDLTDAFKMIKCHNIFTLAMSALQNFDLVLYLVGMLLATKRSRMKDLSDIMPSAVPDDWTLITAGMRVQVIKKDKPVAEGGTGKYIFQFGTEVVFGPNLNICGLLGASPGASTAVQVVFDIVQKAYSHRLDKWKPKLKEMVPSFGIKLANDPQMAESVLQTTAKDLGIVGM